MEVWKDIEDYTGLYQVSDYGRVKSLGNNKRKSEMILKPVVDSFGYQIVCLWKNKKKKNMKIHRLIAKTFVIGYDESKEINHKDGNKLNNTPENLEWVTVKENAQHAFKIGLRKGRIGDEHPARKISSNDVFAIQGLYLSGTFNQFEISLLYEISCGHVGIILSGDRWESLYTSRMD